MSGRHKHLMLLAASAVSGVSGWMPGEFPKAPSIGTAFAGPIRVSLREEISPAAKVISSTAHGEKLEILQVRRRFVRVRTPSGQVGWTDSRNLLSSKQMDRLHELSKSSAKLPAQGEATVYVTLNMHAEPFRTSTTFYQIAEGVRVDVLSHTASPKAAPAQVSGNSLDLNKPAPLPPRKRKKDSDFPPPPPPPPPPGLPSNWLELSESRLPPPPPEPPETPAEKKRKKRRKKPDRAADGGLESSSHQGRKSRLGPLTHARDGDSG